MRVNPFHMFQSYLTNFRVEYVYVTLADVAARLQEFLDLCESYANDSYTPRAHVTFRAPLPKSSSSVFPTQGNVFFRFVKYFDGKQPHPLSPYFCYRTVSQTEAVKLLDLLNGTTTFSSFAVHSALRLVGFPFADIKACLSTESFPATTVLPFFEFWETTFDAAELSVLRKHFHDFDSSVLHEESGAVLAAYLLLISFRAPPSTENALIVYLKASKLVTQAALYSAGMEGLLVRSSVKTRTVSTFNFHPPRKGYSKYFREPVFPTNSRYIEAPALQELLALAAPQV